MIKNDIEIYCIMYTNDEHIAASRKPTGFFRGL